MLPIVVERDNVPMGMEGQLGLHNLLISLLLLENGIYRVTTGKRHVAAFLTDEQRAILAQVPSYFTKLRKCSHNTASCLLSSHPCFIGLFG